MVEWDYCKYEDRRTVEIIQSDRIGCCFGTVVLGQNCQSKSARGPTLVVERVRGVHGDVLLFSSRHFLRALASRGSASKRRPGQHLLLSTATLSALSYEHNLAEPAIRLWNDDRHIKVTSDG